MRAPSPPPPTLTCVATRNNAAEATVALAVLPRPREVRASARGRVVGSAVVQLVSAGSR